jgi:cytochrome c-type biogenesis protein CcmE
MKARHQRLLLILAGLAALAGASALTLRAFRENLVFFYGPSEALARAPAPEQRIRIGGLVEAASVVRDGLKTRFGVTDNRQSIAVVYHGLLPDLFREGQGVVAEGHLGADGVFRAQTILAKHDENYMPPEVADALKKAGQWRPKSGSQSGVESVP